MLEKKYQARIEAVEEDDDYHWCPSLDRRAALRLLGMGTLATMAGCSAGAAATATTSSGTTASVTTLTPSATSASAGASVTLTATVSPAAATGTIAFYNGTTLLGSVALRSGSAALSTSFSAAGTEVLTAVYGGSSAYAASASAAIDATVTGSAACSASLEGEEGPYFVDDSASGYLRSNVVSNLDGTETQTGIPLALTVYVFDSEKACAAMQGVQVDIWSCNAAGVYSAESSESTTGQSWLRGYQITDATGKVQFNTILPGWYSGRTTHIHLRFRSTYDETDTSGSNTMQVFFDQTVINTIATTISPYDSEGTNPTTNATDRVYSTEEDGTTLLTLTGSISAGFAATLNAYLPI